MRDNTIIDKLKRSIEGVTIAQDSEQPIPFYYDDESLLNLRFDQITPPFASAVLLQTGTIERQGGQFAERATLNVFFLDLTAQASADQDGIENERIIDECKQRAFRWLSTFQPVRELKLVSVNSTQRVYIEDDATLTGYAVNITIEEVQTYGRCQL